jgi:hypothetical protein
MDNKSLLQPGDNDLESLGIDTPEDQLSFEKEVVAASQEVAGLEKEVQAEQQQMQSMDESDQLSIQQMAVEQHIIETTQINENPKKAKKLFIRQFLKSQRQDLISITESLKGEAELDMPKTRSLINSLPGVSAEFKELVSGSFGEYMLRSLIEAHNVFQNRNIIKKFLVIGTNFKKLFIKRLRHDMQHMSDDDAVSIMADYEMNTPEFRAQQIPASFVNDEEVDTQNSPEDYSQGVSDSPETLSKAA